MIPVTATPSNVQEPVENPNRISRMDLPNHVEPIKAGDIESRIRGLYTQIRYMASEDLFCAFKHLMGEIDQLDKKIRSLPSSSCGYSEEQSFLLKEVRLLQLNLIGRKEETSRCISFYSKRIIALSYNNPAILQSSLSPDPLPNCFPNAIFTTKEEIAEYILNNFLVSDLVDISTFSNPLDALREVLSSARSLLALSTPENPMFDTVLRSHQGNLFQSLPDCERRLLVYEISQFPDGLQSLKRIVASDPFQNTSLAMTEAQEMLVLSKKMTIQQLLEVNQWLEDKNLCHFQWSLTGAWRYYDKYGGDISEAKEFRQWYREVKNQPEIQKTKQIDVRNDGLTRIPYEIRFYSALEELIIRDNKLMRFPSDVKFPSTLRKLDVENNLLAHLPHTVGDLQHLEEINLLRNPLQMLPSSLTKIPAWKELKGGFCQIISSENRPQTTIPTPSPCTKL